MNVPAPPRADSSSLLASRAGLLAHVQASPLAVGAKDKGAWLALFADGGEVHDPVGTPACRKGAHTLGAFGQDDLARFYDCFIAPNAIRFEVHGDLVTPRAVVRDVTLHVTGPAGVPTAVAAHLVYTLTGAPGALRIARLEAFWQSADVMRTVRRAGARGAAATALNLWQLARCLGLAGARGYLRGVRDRVRSSAAREAIAAWVAGIDAADPAQAAAPCEPGCTIALPNGERVSTAQALAGDLAGWKASAEKVLVCGWAASCALSMRRGERGRRAVAAFDFARETGKIHAIRLYWDTE